MDIQIDDPRQPEVRALLEEHLRDMALHSPPESVHALDVERLRQPGITFFTAREGDALLGCGALKELDPGHAEIKSMRTATAHQRQGVAQAILTHLLTEARRRGYHRVSLETGAAEAFAPAHRLYLRAGFVGCEPFGEYSADRFSVFMTLTL
ncbi:MAG: GNAT family N-acetyltransferase [Minicystis sp.]